MSIASRPRVALRQRGANSPSSKFRIITLAPLLVILVAFVAFPLGQMLWMSVGDVKMRAGKFDWTWVGSANYSRMLDDALFAKSLTNSAVFIFFTVSLTLLVGIALALATDRIVSGQQFFQNIVIWPAIIAPVVISVLWLLLLSPQIGLINKLLMSVGLPTQTWLGQPVAAMVAVIVVDVWHWTPIVYLFVYTALRSIDESILEASEMDGASAWKTIRYITLPLLVPTIIGAMAIRLVMGVKAFDEMYLLTFGGPGNATTVISIYLRTVFQDSFDYGYGAALGTTVVGLVLLALIVIITIRSQLKRLSRG